MPVLLLALRNRIKKIFSVLLLRSQHRLSFSPSTADAGKPDRFSNQSPTPNEANDERRVSNFEASGSSSTPVGA
jgi:hypothetical protein